MNSGLTFALCPGILITWSPAEIDVAVQASLIQFYPILLATLLSIHRQQLSLYDANFALLLTSSPLTVYLVAASACEFCGIETDLYKRIKSNRRAIRVFAILIPFLWLGLSVVLRLSDRAFKDSGLCHGSTFKDWLRDCRKFMIGSTTYPCQTTGPIFFGVFGTLFCLCLFRARSDLKKDIQTFLQKGHKSWKGRLRAPFILVKCVWCVSVVVGSPISQSSHHQGAPLTAITSGIRTSCSGILIAPGHCRSPSPPSPRLGSMR